MPVKSNTQIIYKEMPQGYPDASRTFEIRKGTIIIEDVVLKTDEILVRTIYAAVDPYLRCFMRDPSIESKIIPAMLNGDVMYGCTISEVIKSNNTEYTVGDLVESFSNWEEYSIISPGTFQAAALRKMQNARNSSYPISYHLGLFGFPGLAAYVGLHKIGEPLTPGQTLFVSNAAGAIGQLVGQYGKILGLRVVGSAGNDEKVNYLLKDLGFDAAFNYKKHKDFDAILKQTCPDGIDIYFDNVGGKMLDAAINNCNDHARIPLCGMISQYNRPSEMEPIHNMFIVLGKKIRLEGFVVNEEAERYGEEFGETFTKYLIEGKLKYQEHIFNGIETLPEAFAGLFHGKNFGKVVVKIADL